MSNGEEAGKRRGRGVEDALRRGFLKRKKNG